MNNGKNFRGAVFEKSRNTQVRFGGRNLNLIQKLGFREVRGSHMRYGGSRLFSSLEYFGNSLLLNFLFPIIPKRMRFLLSDLSDGDDDIKNCVFLGFTREGLIIAYEASNMHSIWEYVKYDLRLYRLEQRTSIEGQPHPKLVLAGSAPMFSEVSSEGDWNEIFNPLTIFVYDSPFLPSINLNTECRSVCMPNSRPRFLVVNGSMLDYAQQTHDGNSGMVEEYMTIFAYNAEGNGKIDLSNRIHFGYTKCMPHNPPSLVVKVGWMSEMSSVKELGDIQLHPIIGLAINLGNETLYLKIKWEEGMGGLRRVKMNGLKAGYIEQIICDTERHIPTVNTHSPSSSESGRKSTKQYLDKGLWYPLERGYNDCESFRVSSPSWIRSDVSDQSDLGSGLSLHGWESCGGDFLSRIIVEKLLAESEGGVPNGYRVIVVDYDQSPLDWFFARSSAEMISTPTPSSILWPHTKLPNTGLISLNVLVSLRRDDSGEEVSQTLIHTVLVINFFPFRQWTILRSEVHPNLDHPKVTDPNPLINFPPSSSSTLTRRIDNRPVLAGKSLDGMLSCDEPIAILLC